MSRTRFTILRVSSWLVVCALVAPAAAEGPGWPFIRLRPPAVPTVQNAAWVRNPIDAFVLARLEKAGLQPSPPADRLTLLKRLTHDLTGLAPTAEEREAFLADTSPDAYEKLVDRLLCSPRFGERWAQHWLDVVRFAETEGFKLDGWRPEAYRYRDYVIRAFNDDLPYDRFLAQQVAGDELEPDNPDAVVATGFYRLHPEETNGSNYRMIRQDILDDITDVFSATFLGLTMGCARCHNHKFDPISQRDYFELQAFFAPLLHRDDVVLIPPAERQRYEQQMASWQQATQPIRRALDNLLRPVGQQVMDEVLVTLDSETQQALRTPPDRRTPLQQQLAVLGGKQIQRRMARMHRRLEGEQRKQYDELQKQMAAFDALKPAPVPTAMAVCDVPGKVPTFLLANGNYQKPREEVVPDFPDLLDPSDPDIRPPARCPTSSGRRTALARWLCQPDHPLTSRVIVNRLWQQYLGKGIVGTPNDFGAMGEPATHPELLDFLASELVRHGWRLKAVHRLIVTSATYRQASVADASPTAARAAQVDPANQLLWHARVKRREGEAIRDVALQLSGQLNGRMYGPSALPELPPALLENSRYSWYADEKPEDRNRRSIYVYARRNLQYPLFAVFDAPDRVHSCPTRFCTITPPQALALINGEVLLMQARYWSGRLLARHGAAVRAVIRAAYVEAFGRAPSEAELSAAEQFVLAQKRRIESAEAAPPAGLLPEPLAADIDRALASALVDFCHALMDCTEFLYVE
jgi:hypothetical protein